MRCLCGDYAYSALSPSVLTVLLFRLLSLLWLRDLVLFESSSSVQHWQQRHNGYIRTCGAGFYWTIATCGNEFPAGCRCCDHCCNSDPCFVCRSAPCGLDPRPCWRSRHVDVVVGKRKVACLTIRFQCHVL